MIRLGVSEEPSASRRLLGARAASRCTRIVVATLKPLVNVAGIADFDVPKPAWMPEDVYESESVYVTWCQGLDESLADQFLETDIHLLFRPRKFLEAAVQGGSKNGPIWELPSFAVHFVEWQCSCLCHDGFLGVKLPDLPEWYGEKEPVSLWLGHR